MERPKQATPEIKLAAAKEIVAELVKQDLLDSAQADTAAQDLAGVYPWGDGYETAKELDRLHCWDCNMEMAEILDGYSSTIRHLIEQAEKVWVDANNISPPLPVGSRATYRDSTGTLDGIYEYGPAKYLFKEDGDPEADAATQRRIIVNFEDVTAV